MLDLVDLSGRLGVEQSLGSDKVASLVRQIATGPSDTAGVLAALTDPVPSRYLRERSQPVTVPLGRSLFIDAARDWSGEFDVNSASADLLARAYAADGALNDQ